MTHKDTTKILAPYVRLGFQNEILYLGFGSIQQKIEKTSEQRLFVDLCDLWSEPKSELTIVSEMQGRGYSALELIPAIEILKRGNFLVDPKLYNRGDRFSRHALYYLLNGADPEAVQQKLAKKNVVILGCGGIGNQIAASLATAGVGSFTLVDDDEIELSNLTRQILFTEADEGASKVKVLARELEARNSRIQVKQLSKRIESKGDLASLGQPDLVILSADSPAAMSLLNEWAVDTGVAYLPVGYVNDIAVFGPFYIPGEDSACFECERLVARDSVDQETLQKLKKINRKFQAPSVGPVNMLASSLGLLDALRFLGGFGEIQSLNKRIGIWTHELRKEIQSTKRSPNCGVCGSQAQRVAV